MSILTIAWSMCAAACAMMALLQLLIWLMRRRNSTILWSVAMGASAAVTAVTEMLQMFALSPTEYEQILVWQNASIFGLLISMVWYTQTHFRAGRLWLALIITVLWSVTLVVNFVWPHSVTFGEVLAVKRDASFLGEVFSRPVGTSNPWKIIPDIASLLIAIYILDASFQLWRRGEKRRASVVGFAMLIFISVAGVHTLLVDAGKLHTHYMVSFAFLAIVMAFAYELVSEAVKAAKLTRQIGANEERWRSLLENVELLIIGTDTAGHINYANPYLRQLTGFSQAQLLGKPLSMLVPDVVAAELERRVSIAAETAPRPHSTWDVMSTSGELFEVEWSTVGLKDNYGRYAGLLSIGSDVTQRNSAERDLRITRRQTERLSQAILLGELASTLAHELNQPLAAILTNAQAARRFLQRRPADLDELAEILDDIERDDKRAGEIIRRMRGTLQAGEAQREQLSMTAVIPASVRCLTTESSQRGS